ncbi:MAG: trigger factor [Wujia sp.]|nr:trigger factor [Wujia sp.]MCI6239843.1 trigger factor [Clostridium sp.]MDD7283542.1 trigger factor [Clostridium sp.]MDY3728727.1 trigger factor [Wujia sp.]
MKKQFRALGYVLSLALGMTMLTGCGKKVDGVDQQGMIDKYAAYCDLPDYKGLEYTETKSTVTDADVRNKIDSLLQQYATKTQVKEGTVADGDNVNIDFVGSIDGVEFEGGNSNGAGYDLTLGSGSMIPGFEDGIVGHKVGETFNIKATFPENYGKDELNGKEADFKITINYLTQTELPEYNDAFVASYTDATSILEYEDSVRKDLVEQYEQSDKSQNESAIMQVLVEKTTYNEYPQQEMQDLIDKSIAQQEQAASSYGYSLGDYVTARYGFSDEDSFRQYIQGLAEDYIKEKIAVCAVAKDTGITVTKEEVDNYKKKIMDYYSYEDESKLEENYSSEDIVYYALAEKVVDFLLENGKGVEATATDATTEATSSDASASDGE